MSEQNEIQPERPEGLPENFQSVEALVDSYKQLQSKLTEVSQAPAPAPAAPTPQQQMTIPDPPETLPMERLNQEYAAEGKLSDQTYQMLQEKHGLNRQMVDTYISGQEAQAQAAAFQAQQILGGPEQYQELVQWASENLPPSAIQTYNELVQGTNSEAREMAIRGLYAQYRDAGAPKTITGNTTANTNYVKPFQDNQAMAQAMSDERYGKDVEYTESVLARVKAML